MEKRTEPLLIQAQWLLAGRLPHTDTLANPAGMIHAGLPEGHRWILQRPLANLPARRRGTTFYTPAGKTPYFGCLVVIGAW